MSARLAQEIRSGLIEASEIVGVEKSFTGCRDPKDDMLFDVLEQTSARWICSDDPDVHSLGIREVIGMGELVRMIEEVS